MKAYLWMFMALFFIFSCRKNNLTDNIQSAQDNAALETEFGNIYDVVTGYAQEDELTGKTDGDKILPSGAVVTFQDSLFSSQDGDPLEFTIDYGPLKNVAPKGLLCKDGRYRSGKIHVSLKEKFGTPDNQIIINITDADKYYVGNGTNMYQLTGTKTINRIGSQKKWIITVSNASLQTDKGTIRWTATRTLEQSIDVPGSIGDEYQIYGNASGINAEGESFSVAVISPLIKRIQLGCLSTFVSGIWTLKNSSGDQLTVDYDPYLNKACDRTIRVQYNNKSRIINVW
ncbi:MAG: hypothetical protein RMJ53_07430 [Chitinophagales bacterium]|nr:hypothetical protein [Chitinophagales bacterium]MDW8274042.1 hypothetical protein [Chitinophagales bacterium]